MTSLPPSRSDPLKAINTSSTWDLWQSCHVCRPGNTAPWPRPSPYRWPPGETLGACPQGNGDGTRPKGLGHPAEGQGVNCPPLSPSRLWSSSGGKVFPNLIQIWIASLGPIRNCQNPWQKPAQTMASILQCTLVQWSHSPWIWIRNPARGNCLQLF